MKRRKENEIELRVRKDIKINLGYRIKKVKESGRAILKREKARKIKLRMKSILTGAIDKLQS